MSSIVFLTVDCLRADHVGCYEYDRPTTPNIDGFAETEATKFECAYANCPGTRWAFQTLHTGLYTNQIDGLGIPDPETTPVMASLLRDHGYATGGFANNGYVSRDYDYDTGFETFHGVTDFADDQSSFESLLRTIDAAVRRSPLAPYTAKLYELFESRSDRFEPSVTDADVCNIAIDWISRRKAADEDFFAWIHLMDAHTPYARHDDYLEEIRGDTDIEHVIHPGRSEIVSPGEEPPERLLDTYDTGVRSADEQIGSVLEVVDPEDTVVITGDHGEEFGRYGEFHQASLYSSFTQVPLVIQSPSLPAGESISTPAQHIDIPPTILTDAGVSVPDHWPGIPIQNRESRSQSDPIFFQIDNKCGVRAGNWKLTTSDDTDEQYLYQVAHMSQEGDSVTNEHKRGELAEMLVEHRQAIDERSGTDREQHENLSDETEDNLRNLGYID